MKKLIALCAALIVAFPILAQEEAAPELPVIPYYTSAEGGRQFNVPIPEGWAVDDDNPDYLRLHTANAPVEIFVLNIGLTDAQEAIAEALNRIDAGERTRRAESAITFDGLEWEQAIYDTANGNVSAFAQVRDDLDLSYVLLYAHMSTASDLYAVALQSDDPGDPRTLDDALNLLFDDFSAEAEETTERAFGRTTWVQNRFVLPDGDLHTLHQMRGGTIYVVAERGDSATLTTANRALFTVLFGFFVTPDNANFLWLGLGATFFILLVLIASIYLRYLNAQKDLKLIEQLEAE